VAVLLAASAVSSAAAVGPRVTREDRAATHAYLLATYAFERAVLANASAANAAVARLASRLASECPGVLSGAPQESLKSQIEHDERSPRSPRQEGESNREHTQLTVLQDELTIALSLSDIEPSRQAALTYARTVKSLRWSDPAVTLLEHSTAAALEAELEVVPPGVCADMKAWAATAYKRLSPATKTFEREREAVLAHFIQLFRHVSPAFGGHARPTLAGYEGPSEKALARAIARLRSGREASYKALQAALNGLQNTLGFAPEPAPEASEGPPKGSVVIGHGRTAAGTHYTIRLEPKQPPSGPSAHGQSGARPLEPPCPLRVSVSESSTGPQGAGEGAVSFSGSGETCLSSSHPVPARVSCQGGILTVEAQTLRRARTARLLLSDGRTITSGVAIVPARLGGPAGLYYQAVRGPSPIPVSLTELDAHGRTLRTVKLNRVVECTVNLFHYLPGGLRTLARGVVPGGPAFSIVGKRYRMEGQVHFELTLEVEGKGGLLGSRGSEAVAQGQLPRPASPFSPSIETGCLPHEYAILYGILKAPRDTVVARISGTLQPLRRAPIPTSLHAGGVLVYIVLPAIPSEVLVRTPGGKTVASEQLTTLARETSEKCQGEAEG
jgi:hypothetical protein